MKAFAIAAIIIALYLLHRIAPQKPSEAKKDNDGLPKNEPDTGSIVGKSRFVLGRGSQPQPTPAVSAKMEDGQEKGNTFAPENAKLSAVIPLEELDEVFSRSEDLEMDAELANGFSYEELLEEVFKIGDTSRIKAVIDRHVTDDTVPQDAENSDYGDFDIKEFLN